MSTQPIHMDFYYTVTPEFSCFFDLNLPSQDSIIVKFKVKKVKCSYTEAGPAPSHRIFFNPQSVEGSIVEKSFVGERVHLVGSHSRTHISNALNQTGIPREFQWRIIHKIRNTALSMLQEAPRKTVMRVKIKLVDAERVDMVNEQLKAKISGMSVKNSGLAVDMEDIVMNDMNGLCPDVCSICLQGLFSMPEKVVKRMPCFHKYHGSCIISWLERRHVCPVCQYEMPIERNFDFVDSS